MVELRCSGLPLVGRVPWGTDVCGFYRQAGELLDLLVPYFRAGLQANEYCLWLTPAPVLEARATEALGSGVPDLETRIRGGQIDIVGLDTWCAQGGAFDVAHVIARLQARLEETLALGYDGMRVAGSMPWLDRANWRVIADQPILALRTFDLNLCSADQVMDVLVGHQYALVNSSGAWAVLESSKRQRPGDVPQQRDQRLRPLLEHMTQLVRSATHDLRTPLAAIAMAAQGARRRPECQVAARGLDTIVRSCERIDAMLTDVAIAGRLELASTDPKQETVECSRFVPELLSQLSEKLDTRRLHVAIPEELPPVQVDPKHFEQILEIALAIVLGASAADEQVVLEATSADDGVEILVAVRRQAIEAETRPHSSGRFERSTGAPNPEGSGRERLARDAKALGLLLMRALVEANRGTVCIDSASGPETRILLRLVRSGARRAHT